MVRKAVNFNTKGVANVLHALAKFDHYDKAVVEKLCVEVVRKAGDFNPQCVGNTLNALAKFDHYDKAVVERLCAEVVRKAGDFEPEFRATLKRSHLHHVGNFWTARYRVVFAREPIAAPPGAVVPG